MTTTSDDALNVALHELFERQAARRPDSVAVVDVRGPVPYSTLLRQVHAIAAALTRHGIRPEQPIGVLAHRTSDLIAVLLGILRAGGCYVPLDPDDPADRNRAIVEGAACSLVVGHGTLLEEFRPHLSGGARPVEFLPIEPICGESPAGSAPAPLPLPPGAPGGHRLAYILFTSGSTGAPKGVEVEHRAVVNLLSAVRDLFQFTESDRYLAVSTIGFDISVAEIFLPLVTGATVVLRDRRLLMEPRRLADQIREHGVTVFQTGPSVWSVLLDEVPDFPKVRVAITTGEAVPPGLAARLADRGDLVWNLYGPTETTVWATGFRLDRSARGVPTSSTVSAPIGGPLANVEVRLLDDQLAPVAPGSEGELWIGGEALARGYCRNEAITRERFRALGTDGGRFYRTGDVVTQDPDGTLHYFGRNDDQIKVRGVRIEPMEVESAILAHPSVSQAAATWHCPDPGSTSRSIVAGIVLKPRTQATPGELHAHLSHRLTPAMIPSRFVFLETLPRTPSGKVDRNAIRARAGEATPDAGDSSEGATETERTLIRIWEQTLKIRPVHRTDHFFTIGGDSLSAVTMMLEVESTYGITLPVRVIFEVPTLDRFAARVDRVRSRPDDLGNSTFIFPLSQGGRGRPVFFCSVDLRMAHRDLWTPDCPLYSVSLWAQGTGFVQAATMEELALAHIERVRSIQPQGPYRLAGYSFGGLVALEMAHQLRKAGETVELLFLLDPSSTYENRSKTPMRSRKQPNRTAAPATPGPLSRALGSLWEPIRALGATAWQWLNYQIVHLHGSHPNPISARILPRNRWPAFWYTARRLSRSYVPEPYDGPCLAVFVAREHQYETWSQRLGPKADLRIIPADHLELFSEPARSAWLNPLRALLDGAPRTTPGTPSAPTPAAPPTALSR